MKRLLLLAALAVVAGCTSPDVDYCKRYGEVEGTPMFGKCLDYYHQQDGAFQRDLSSCAAKADLTYPRALYDEGSHRTARVYGGPGWGQAGWDGPETIWIDEEPDYEHNALVDSLRRSVIRPCMNQHGWNSDETWEHGRINEGKKRYR